MKKLSALFVFALVFGFALVASPAQAQDSEENNTETNTTQEANTEQAPEEATNSYDYVAQVNDTYTQMARKAIQTYGLVNGVNLSGAQIVYAETNMTLEAGSPQLTVGQEVSLDEATVQQWVEKAQQLSDADEQAWEYYVQFVDFNTNGVGEASN